MISVTKTRKRKCCFDDSNINGCTWSFCRLSAWPDDDSPDNKVHETNMGPIWGRQDPGGPHVGPMNLAIRVIVHWTLGSYYSKIATKLHTSPFKKIHLKIPPVKWCHSVQATICQMKNELRGLLHNIYCGVCLFLFYSCCRKLGEIADSTFAFFVY